MAAHDGPAWSSEAAHEVVRPYALTGGRTKPKHRMRLVSRLITRREAAGPLTPEAEQAVKLCRGQGRAVAEIAATLGQPVQVTKILLSDLIDSGALIMALPSHAPEPDPKDPALLEAVLAGLRHKFAV